jgi:S1-C subfamily serine protease
MKFALVHLSGHKRGETQYFDRPWLSLGSDPVNDVVFAPDGRHPVSPAHAELFQTDCEMRLRNRDPDVGTLLNNLPVDEAILADRDIIRLGPKGPKLRFRIRPEEYAACKLTSEILDDARAVADEARDGGRGAVGPFVSQVAYDLRRHASRTTQVVVVGLLVLLLSVVTGAIYSGYKTRKALERHMTALTEELESARRTQADLERRVAEERAKVAEALAARQTEMDRLVSRLDEERRRGGSAADVRALTQRLDVFEKERTAAEELIKRYGPSVCFLYIAYGFVQKGEAGAVPSTLLEYMGTGFLIDDRGHIATNRHIAEPWSLDPAGSQYEKSGMEARLVMLAAFFPGRREPYTVSLVRLSDVADVALGRLSPIPQNIAPIPIRKPEPKGIVGEAVVLLGYPVGVEGVLARMDDETSTALVKKHRGDLRGLVQDIADRGAVRPLATQGHIGDIVGNRIVYDAQTTGGGSGSPVFNSRGEVIAVNAATMTRFGGASFGVPIGLAMDLLSGAP